MPGWLTISNLIFILGGLGIALKLWLKFRPQDKDELQMVRVGIDLGDGIIDVLLETFPDNQALNTVDDVVEVVQKQFEKAGIRADRDKVKEKVQNKVELKEGFSLDLDDEFKIKYSDKF